jgi:hypothetical protein
LNSGNIASGNVLSFTSPVDITGGSTHNVTVAGITNIAGVTSGCGGRNLSKYGAGILNLRLSGASNCNTGFLRHRNESTGAFNIYATGVVTSGRLLFNATDPAAASTLAVGDDFDVVTGIVTPGIGTWNVNGEISLQSATTVDIDLNGPAVSEYDRLTYTYNQNGSNVSLNDATLNVNLGFTPDPGDTFSIISRIGITGTVNGNFRDLPQGSVFTANGVQLLINYLPIVSPTAVILTRVDIPSLGIEATGGSGQSTNIETDFSLPLAATVRNQNDDPVPNALVTFNAPASGASAAFPAGNQRLTDVNGVVTVTVRANSVPGSYNVTANLSPEQVTPASFSLTNTAPALSIDDPSAVESAGIMTFTVTLSEPTSLDVTIDYSTSNGTALDGVDYVGASGHLTITAGLTETIIPVSVISNSVVEGSRTFTMTLSNPSHAVISKNQGIGTILDDDVAPAPETKTYLPLIFKN